MADDICTDKLKTNEFISAIKQERVVSVNYNPKDYTVTGEYYPAISAGANISNIFNFSFDALNYQLSLHKDSNGKNLAGVQTEKQKPQDLGDKTKYTSIFIGQDTLVALLAHHQNIQYVIEIPNSILETIFSYLPFILMAVLIMYFITQMSKAHNSQFGFGKTKARKASEERPKVKFSDVAGIDEAVEDMKEVEDFLANHKKYQSIGAKIPKGVLLVGPPGTGKTLLAKAVSGEAGVPFFSISGSDFVEMFVGVGASRVRDLFKQAKVAQPCIIFIDEIDAVGRQRGAGLGGGHDEREQTLNQLLVEMDGFDENQSVVLIAATNRVDILDPALLRPGRFDRQIIVDTPDVKGREKILKVHSENKPLGSDVDIKKIAQLTSGFTGADLANLMNEAALLSVRYNKKIITMKIVTESMERVLAGPERKSRVIDCKTKDIITFHECGHALVGHKLIHTDPVHKISIISRGRALGYTISIPEEDKILQSKNEMLDNLAMLLAGRCAEEIFFDDITTGASNDLERATKIARAIVTQYGMSEALGTQTYGEQNKEVFLGRNYFEHKQDYSDETANRIDAEVSRIMEEAHKR
ncbi:MAG: ATP-dependent zinc metalloprotease FtsH, partial [Eggerthellaceae bacterium]|nr:ATP-dependent zinc metalloprotease FtsH [Eggerthellaceae bacterium]